jgi:hypothetical protein
MQWIKVNAPPSSPESWSLNVIVAHFTPAAIAAKEATRRARLAKSPQDIS